MIKKLIYILLSIILILQVNAESYVSYWNFNSDAKDLNGKNNGTVSGAILTSACQGNGYKFDGVNDNINFSASNSLGIDEYNFTEGTSICAWINATEIQQGAIFGRFWNNYEFSLTSLGRLQYSATYGTVQADEISTSNLYWKNKCIFICVTSNATKLVYYVNGSQKDTDDVTGSIRVKTGTERGYVGLRRDDVIPYNGTIDELRFYNRSIGISTIRNLYYYNNEHNTTCEGQITYTNYSINQTSIFGYNSSREKRVWMDCDNYNYTIEWNFHNFLNESYKIAKENKILLTSISSNLKMIAGVMIYSLFMLLAWSFIKNKQILPGIMMWIITLGFDFYLIGWVYESTRNISGSTFYISMVGISHYFIWIWLIGKFMMLFTFKRIKPNSI